MQREGEGTRGEVEQCREIKKWICVCFSDTMNMVIVTRRDATGGGGVVCKRSTGHTEVKGTCGVSWWCPVSGVSVNAPWTS